MDENLTNDREPELTEEMPQEMPQEEVLPEAAEAAETDGEMVGELSSSEAIDRLIESVREQTRAEIYDAIRQRGTRPFAIPVNSASVGADFHRMPESTLRAAACIQRRR